MNKTYIGIDPAMPNSEFTVVTPIQIEVGENVTFKIDTDAGLTGSTGVDVVIEDYIFGCGIGEGRGSKVDKLPGGDNLGDIDDLKYFENKLYRSVGIPRSYMPDLASERDDNGIKVWGTKTVDLNANSPLVNANVELLEKRIIDRIQDAMNEAEEAHKERMEEEKVDYLAAVRSVVSG